MCLANKGVDISDVNETIIAMMTHVRACHAERIVGTDLFALVIQLTSFVMCVQK